MFRLYRKTIFPRWHVSRKTSANSNEENQNLKHPKTLILCTTLQNQKHSNQNDHKKQHADKQEKQYWDNPQFHFNFLRTSMLETAGWLGTAALYFSVHLKHINNIFDYDKTKSSCIFSNIVLAMPKHLFQDEKQATRILDPVLLPSNIPKQIEEKITNNSDILESIKHLTDQYICAVRNSAGMRNINKNDRKAFRYFQSAARLGSSQGFYNLGLCHHLGKGTKVNLNMAAYCYRKAAMKGHGLASFNLAIFFYKGMGGLPIDTKIAKQLLAAAAEKGIPEAQLYFGIEFLEEKRWQEAVRIFSNLSEKNLPVAQYYLGLCYESGLGVEKNEQIASVLFKKSAAQGNKRAFHKLQNQEKKVSNSNYSESSTLKSKGRNKNLHVSASVPELGAIERKSVHSTSTITISSYLDLTTPVLLVKNIDSRPKDNFFINEDKFTKECSSIFLPFKSMPLVMKVKI